MDIRNMPDTGRDAGQPAARLHLEPIAEYLRHISREGDDAQPDLLGLPRKLYRVSEIAQHLDVTRQTVHNYATIGLITEEARTPGGQRLFDESVFPRLLQIQRLKRTHRLHEIRRLFDTQQRRGPHAADAARAADADHLSGSPARDPQPKGHPTP